ncbi:MAG: endonuclease IV [Ruminococcaceae bacterium]|nr:endonuclease IV [Oscillospiraceae bacterium]
MLAKFGPGGNCEKFYNEGNKSSLQIPAWVKGKGLSAYEYECGKGIKISEDSAKILGENAKAEGITLSVHAPYFISLSSTEAEKREKSVKYILDTLAVADTMKAGRVVVHSGSCSKITRKAALELAVDTVSKALRAADEAGLGHINICPETMGKVKQLGTIEEVCAICSLDERLIPTVDFGHVNSMTLGGLKNIEDYERIFDVIKNKLGSEREKNFHIHYSRIEFTNAGEKKHRTYSETEYGPEFEPIAEIIAKRGLCPTIICESRGTQTEDSVLLMKAYMEKRKIYV